MAAQGALPPLVRRHRLMRLRTHRPLTALGKALRSAVLGTARGLVRNPIALLWLAWIGGGIGLFALVGMGHP